MAEDAFVNNTLAKLSANLAKEGKSISDVFPGASAAKSTPKKAVNNLSNSFIDTLQSKLLEQSDLVSSADTGIEQAIQSAISGIGQAQAASAARIESQFGRELAFQTKEGLNQITQAQESGAGFATPLVALRRLVETTDKELKDLDQRRQELILQGESAAASQIAGLQMQALQFQQEAKQRAFSNLLSIGNFSLSAQAELRAQEAQDFAEQSAIANIALEFGLAFDDNDTLDTIIAKAAPLASEERLLNLQKIKADIANTKAQTAKALQGDADSGALDPMVALSLAQAFRDGNTDFLSGLKTNEQMAAVLDAVSALDGQEENELRGIAQQHASAADFLKAVANSGKVYDEAIATRVATSEFANQKSQSIFSKILQSSGANQSSQSSLGTGNNRLDQITVLPPAPQANDFGSLFNF